MKAAIIKAIIQLLADEKTRKRVTVLLLSLVTGLLGMMIMPIIVLQTLGKMQPPEIAIDESALLSGISTEQTAAMEADGQAIADALAARGLQRQTLKAQLVYISCFEEGQISNFDEYADIFSIGDDSILVASLNSTYGLTIEYEDFERTYMLVKNVTIDKYLFTNAGTKNCTDLAAWCRNAYESEWLYQPGGFGDLDENLRRRTADNVGLILGYFNYIPAEKVFGNDTNTLVYTVQGGMDTMPDIAGLGVFTGSEFGIYDGSGQVFFASADGRSVEKISLSDGRWVGWCTFEGIGYPQAVWDAVYAIQHPTEETTEEERSSL